MRILIVDRDEVAARVLAFVARQRGHSPTVVMGIEAFLQQTPLRPDACILTLREGGVAPRDATRAIRARYPAICLLVALDRSRDDEVLPMLEDGVQDVLRSPFDPREAIARLELRVRSQDATAGDRDVVAVGDLVVDLGTYVARKNGVPLQLTKLELRLLFALAMRQNAVTKTDQLLAFGWDAAEPPLVSSLKTHMSRLRIKLARAGGDPMRIEPRHTLGYTLVRPADEEDSEAPAV